jgi:hypothetical protein
MSYYGSEAWKDWNFAKSTGKRCCPESEEIFARDAQMSYEYAKEVIGGRWPEAENAIKKSRDWKWYIHGLMRKCYGHRKAEDEKKWSWIHSKIDENLIEILNEVGMNGRMQAYILDRRPDLIGRMKKVFPELKVKYQHELELSQVDL